MQYVFQYIYFYSSENSFIAKRVPLVIPYLCFSLSFARRVHILFIMIGAISFLREPCVPCAKKLLRACAVTVAIFERETSLLRWRCASHGGRTCTRLYLSPSMGNRDGRVLSLLFSFSTKKGIKKETRLARIIAHFRSLLIAGQFYWTHDT